MLEVIMSDFARLEGDTEAAEQMADDEYNKFEEDKAVKTAEIKHKEGARAAKEQALVSAKNSLEETQGELDAAMAYYEKLKPTCVDTGMSFEERVQARKEEIQSLKEAYEMLGGDPEEAAPPEAKALYAMD